MATITQRLAFLISANADGAIKAFDKTAQQAEKQLGKASKSIDKLGADMTRFGAMGLAAAGTLGAGLFRLAQGAIEDQKAQALLAEQLRTSTGATNAQIAAVEKNIDAMARATGVADDQLRPALGNLVRATGDTTKAQQLLQTSLDISAATGRDLEAVTLAISRAATGNIGALSRLGIPLDENVKKSKDFEAALAALNAQFGGAAAVAADTYAGKMARAQVAISEAGESIGTAFVPVIETASKALQSGIAIFDGFNRATNGAVGAIATFGTVALGAVSGLSLIGGQLIKMRSQLFQVDEATGKFTRNLTTLGKGVGIGTAAIGVATIAYSLYAGAKAKAEQQTRNLTDALKAEAEGNKESLQEIIKSDKNLQRYITQLNNLGLNLGDVREYIESNTGAFKDYADVLTGQVEPGSARYEKVLLQINKALTGSDTITSELGTELQFLGGQTEKIVAILQEEAKAADLASQALGDLGDATEDLTQKQLVQELFYGKEGNKMWLQREKIARQIAEGNKKLAESTANSTKTTQQDTEVTKKATAAKEKFARKVADAAEAVREKLNIALEESKDKLKEATDAYNSYMQGVSSAISGTINFGSAQGTAASNAEAYAQAQAALTDAQKEYNNAIRSGDTERITEAYTKLGEAQSVLNAEASKPRTFMDVLREQASAAAQFGTNIDRLLAANLDPAAIDQILSAGAEAGNQIATEILNGADPAGKVAEINNLVKSTQDIADRVAKATADKFYAAGVQQATALVEGMQAVFDAWTPALGEDAVAGLLNPIKSIADYGVQVDQAVAAATVGQMPAQPKLGKKKKKIPKLAEGGIVQSEPGGRLVLLGEGGRDEAVIPLPAGGGMGGNVQPIQITVNAGLGADGTQIGKEIVDVLVQYQRRVGALPLKVV